jgi:hypothetical protein
VASLSSRNNDLFDDSCDQTRLVDLDQVPAVLIKGVHLLPERIGSGTAHTPDGWQHATRVRLGPARATPSGRARHLPILVLSHGKRALSTLAAERSWTRMQRQLSADSSNTLRVIAVDEQIGFEETGRRFSKRLG